MSKNTKNMLEQAVRYVREVHETDNKSEEEIISDIAEEIRIRNKSVHPTAYSIAKSIRYCKKYYEECLKCELSIRKILFFLDSIDERKRKKWEPYTTEEKMVILEHYFEVMMENEDFYTTLQKVRECRKIQEDGREKYTPHIHIKAFCEGGW